MVGCVMTRIFPAMVMPSVLTLQVPGFGNTTVRPSMIVGSAALYDVVSDGRRHLREPACRWAH